MGRFDLHPFSTLFTPPSNHSALDNQPSVSIKNNPARLVFIDVLRAYAILMMLQGHFVDTLLAPAFRNPESIVFSTWSFMRGMTAPVFFTVTGLVFIYLMMRDGRPLSENTRVNKGLRRGLFLVGVGYLLKFNFLAFLKGYISSWFWAADVLQVIGFALMALVGVAALRERVGGSLTLWMLVLGTVTFFADAYFSAATWDNAPRLLAHYLTTKYGSNFVLVPWLGYAFYGGALGTLLSRRPQLAFGHVLPVLMLVLGVLLHLFSADALVALHKLTQWDYLPLVFGKFFLFWRLGHVLIVISLFMWAIPRVGKIPSLITKIGSETLTVYGAHYVILYGTWVSFGLKQAIGYRTLDPIPCAIGALLFVLAHVWMIANIEAIRAFLDDTVAAVRSLFAEAFKVANAWVLKKVSR